MSFVSNLSLAKKLLLITTDPMVTVARAVGTNNLAAMAT